MHSNWTCCQIRSPNRRSRLYCRCSIVLPRIHWPRTSRIRRSRHGCRQWVESCKGTVPLLRVLNFIFWSKDQTLAGYDEDSTLSIDALLALKTCNGRIGATGMCLGGHLAFRCALDPRVSAAVTYFATDLHSATLGLGKEDDSLARCGEIKAELAMIHGTLDNHVPPEGRDLIRKTLRDTGLVFSWYEPAGAQRKIIILDNETVWWLTDIDAFIRDELSKGRYDPAISKICFEILLELFGRTLKLDLGSHDGVQQEIEDICWTCINTS